MPNKVYVLNKHGRPLMPCSPAKARHLLDEGKAKVKKRTPFTIQLVYGSSGYTQEVILGVDAGSKTIGMSASTKKEELFAANVNPRNDVVDLLSTRREFRRARRNRKTSSGEMATPASAAEHTRPRKRKYGSTSIIWRAEKPAAMLPAIKSRYARAAIRNSTRD